MITMPRNDKTPVPLRFYVVRRREAQELIDELHKDPFSEDMGKHKPEYVEMMYLVSPDEGHNFCSAQRMTRLVFLSIDIAWEHGITDEDDFDLMDSEWADCLRPDEDVYVDASRVVRWNDGNPVFLPEYSLVTELGEFLTYEDAEKHYWENET